MDGTPGGIRLVEYGIQTEQSDFRIHVCFLEGAVYLFETRAAKQACDTGLYPKRPAYQTGVNGATAMGYLVPPIAIRGCRRIPVPAEILAEFPCSVREPTSARGHKAMQVAQSMMHRGLITLPVAPSVIEGKENQIAGKDIQANGKHDVQVKCDYAGGQRPAGTGNLYLQYSERNPLGLH